MQYFKRNPIWQACLEKWGKNAQFDVFVEELAELTQALMKYKRFPTKENALKITEEMGDVQLMMWQFSSSVFFNNSDLVAQNRYNKELRLMDRLGITYDESFLPDESEQKAIAQLEEELKLV